MAMTKDDIIRMAKEAGFERTKMHGALERFAYIVAAAEREECAKRLDAIGCDHCATNIRLRGQ
jgi:hypothetical protein